MTEEFKKTLFSELADLHEQFKTFEEASVELRRDSNIDAEKSFYAGCESGFRQGKLMIEVEINFFEKLIFLKGEQK